MKRILIYMSFGFFLGLNQIALGSSAPLFTVLATGTPANVNITLCLNGKGPLSCQNFNVSASTLSIATTIPNHTYPFAGIKINTPGFTPQGCTPISNGYCVFSVSNTAPARILISQNRGYTIGGTISGLTTGGLGLLNNGGDNLSVSANDTTFTFAIPVAFGGNYDVTILTQPTGFLCTVSNGSSTNVTANVTTVTIACSMSPFAYVVNNGSGDISAYSMNPSTGLLTQISDSPFATGDGPNSIAINPAGSFAYVVSNQGFSNIISAYSINSSTGALTPVSGSPFGAGDFPVSIAINPAGSYAYVGNGNSTDISAYSINPSTGSLTPINGSPFGTGGLPISIAISSAGTFAYVANQNSSDISAYSINPSTGSLTPISGSPFGAGSAPVSIALRG